MLGRRRHLLLSQQVVGRPFVSNLLRNCRPARLSYFKALKTFCGVAFSLALDLCSRWLRRRGAGNEGQGRYEGCGDQSKFQECLPSFAARHSTSFCGVTP